ncbi:uncharacterized protein K02A2.6-like [Eupeodes corollae]|uniref:uncharacterized protein K02A2.6-like n=1 Tax=Eupeodes corollae TaxID=290404 RepID=UPI002490ADAF|nr:uncharacterized protein K02A2.6-like [Eupeodes corollae]
MIRDIIVLYTPHDTVRTQALQKIDPELKDVLDIATAYETSQKTFTAIKENNNEMEVNALSTSKGCSQSRTQSDSARKSCPSCFVNHQRSDCRHNKTVCHKCKKIGHIAAVCLMSANDGNASTVNSKRNKKHKSNRRDKIKSSGKYTANSIEQIHFSEVVTSHECAMVKAESRPWIMVDVVVNGCPMRFQVDTGASCSLVGLEGFQKLGQPKCCATTKSLQAYGGTPLRLKEELAVQVTYENSTYNMNLLVVDGSGANILRLDWFKAFSLKVQHSILQIKSNDFLLNSIETLCKKYGRLFSSGLGKCTSFQAHLELKEGAVPKFVRHRQIPYALLDGTKKELDRLVAEGILSWVQRTQWAAPVVVIVEKANGGIRICGDFKTTVNPQIVCNRHPLPRPRDLFHKLRGGKVFSKIDLSEAYLQIELDESSRDYVVINTPFGLLRFKRLPYGISSARGEFQGVMGQIFADLPVGIYIDDMVIAGTSEEEHLQILEEVLKRLEANAFRCNKRKCTFAAAELEYLGHTLNSNGIRPSEKHLDALRCLPRPTNVKELEAVIGKLNYYNQFISNFSQVAGPLNSLRAKGVKFVWSEQQQIAFESLKNSILKATRLAHFDVSLPIILATDASSYGIGAVISHRFPDGSERPIAFASKTLDCYRKLYSQIEKEALSIIFGVKKFHCYLYGRIFELQTDHKPLTVIFNPSKQIPEMTMRRLRNWAYILMGYQIKYRPAAKHANADALSRLPIGPDVSFGEQDNNFHKVNTLILEDLDTTSINATVIGNLTKNDKLLNKVSSYIKKGWPVKLASNEKELKPFFEHYDRVIIPEALQSRALQYIHEGHWGCSRMKQFARRYIWFPDMDKQIEKLVANCVICQTSASNPKKEYVNWQPAENPWERIHLDFAGPFFNQMWLICVDSFSKFPFVVSLSSVTSESTIRALQMIFAIEGLPKKIVTDNMVRNSPLRQKPKFQPNQKVLARQYRKSKKWCNGVITNVLGSNMYGIQTDRGYIRRHQNQLRLLEHQPEEDSTFIGSSEISPISKQDSMEGNVILNNHEFFSSFRQNNDESSSENMEIEPKQESFEQVTQPTSEVHQHASKHADRDSPAGPLELRRSKRPKKAPVRFPQGC